MTNLWIIIAFLTIQGPTESYSAWLNYNDIYPSKIFCETLLKSRETDLIINLKSVLIEKNMINTTIDNLICLNSQEVKALDIDQYLNLDKTTAGIII